MNPGGDAAEQVVRLSLEGVEVAARITGTGAKNIASLRRILQSFRRKLNAMACSTAC